MQAYAVVKSLAEGSYGQVYLVVHRHTKTKYVLKQVPLPNDKAERDQCLLEARLMAELHHPHVISCHDIFQHGNALCMVGGGASSTPA